MKTYVMSQAADTIKRNWKNEGRMKEEGWAKEFYGQG
jgi:hypothetical protein